MEGAQTMSTYRAPGVYVEEVPSAIKPIAGVGTSTAGFIGVGVNLASDQMPERPGSTEDKRLYYTQAAALEPQPINSWEEFRQKFGDFESIVKAQKATPAAPTTPTTPATTATTQTTSGNAPALTAAANQYLAHAVYGFFNNGGTRCWVTRIADLTTIDAALAHFEAIDEIAMVAVPLPPDTTATALQAAQASVVAHCTRMEDRVAILDSARDIPGNNLVIDANNGIARPASEPHGYGAFYFPWIAVADPLGQAGDRVFVPPSGHIAGIYSRSDAQRGVHKAPANEVVMGALGLRYPVSKILQGSLNLEGVNCIRSFNGTIKVYGARTLASGEGGDPEWAYVNVRRLFNFLRESIDQGTQWVVFEPNSPQLWAKIRRNVTAFLTNVWSSGALFGNTPAEAFYVRCDETTNSESVRELGQVVTEIGVAVVRPAEFVIFRVSQWAGPGG
jgi:phage tail sheath protein FI